MSSSTPHAQLMLPTAMKPILLGAMLILPIARAATEAGQEGLRGRLGVRSVGRAGLGLMEAEVRFAKVAQHVRDKCQEHSQYFRANQAGVDELTRCVSALNDLSTSARSASIESGRLNRKYTLDYSATVDMIDKVGQAAARAKASVMQDTKHAQGVFGGQIDDIIRDLDTITDKNGRLSLSGSMEAKVSPRGHLKPHPVTPPRVAMAPAESANGEAVILSTHADEDNDVGTADVSGAEDGARVAETNLNTVETVAVEGTNLEISAEDDVLTGGVGTVASPSATGGEAEVDGEPNVEKELRPASTSPARDLDEVDEREYESGTS